MSALTQRRSHGVLGAVIAGLCIVALAVPAAAEASVIDGPGDISTGGPVIARGTDVAAPDQQAPSPVVIARGTDVAAPDQQAPSPVVNARGTDVAAPDQQAPRGSGDPVAVGVSDDSLPTFTLMALLALALGGLGFASWLVANRKRSRAAV